MNKKVIISLFISVILAFAAGCKDKPVKGEDPTAMKYLTTANRDFELKKYEKAVPGYKKALELLKFEENRNAAQKYLSQSYINLARDAFNSANYSQALGYYKEALNQQSYELEKPLKAALLTETGLCYFQLSKLGAAIKSYDSALKLDPEAKKVRFYIGNVFMTQRKYDLAISEYKKEIVINKNFAEVYNNLGTAHIALNQSSRSIPYFKKAINLNGNYYKAYRNLASAYSNLSKYDKAILWYKKLLAKNPRFTEAYVYMAEIYMLISDQTNAYKMLRSALKKGYKNWNYLLNYSRGLRTAREYGWFKKLIKKYKK